MMFELREALVRQIIFAMENQKTRYLVDLEKGTLLREDLVDAELRPDDDIDPEGRFQDIPQWKSADGFFLMEQFLTEVQEPTIRDRLQTILLSGSRVFRRFKDTIRESPEIQRRYYRYKYRAMRDVVVEWYNTMRELKGLDALELGADEELEDLLVSNIEITKMESVPNEVIRRLDREAFQETYIEVAEALASKVFDMQRRGLPDPDGEGSVVVGAKNPEEELVGFLWMVREREDDANTVYTVHQLFVQPEYRGLGIAHELLEYARTTACKTSKAHLIWNAGPETPATRALARSCGLFSLSNSYYC